MLLYFFLLCGVNWEQVGNYTLTTFDDFLSLTYSRLDRFETIQLIEKWHSITIQWMQLTHILELVVFHQMSELMECCQHTGGWNYLCRMFFTFLILPNEIFLFNFNKEIIIIFIGFRMMMNWTLAVVVMIEMNDFGSSNSGSKSENFNSVDLNFIFI